MSRGDLIAAVAGYYTAKVREHGPTPEGVDWNGADSQEIRFDQLLAIADGADPLSIVDYGCGYGALVDHVAADHADFAYQGYDVSDSMVAEARTRFAHERRASFTTEPGDLERADYTVASGIFNVKLDTPIEEWRAYVLETIERMAALSMRGIAFNALTAHSDPERMRPDLYYADPAQLLDHCLRTYSRDIALRHDYELYEFTLLVRLDGRPPVRP